VFLLYPKICCQDYSDYKAYFKTSLFIDPFGNIYPSDIWNIKLGNLNKIDNWVNFAETANQKDVI